MWRACRQRMMLHHSRKTYRIRMRPTRQGEFLYFPNGWKKGGTGYLLSRSQKQRLEYPALHKYDAPILTLAVSSCFLPFVIGLPGLIPMIGLIALWYFLIKRRQEHRRTALLQDCRPAPFKMTKNRYQLEYASQYSFKILKIIGLGLFALALIAVIQIIHHLYTGRLNAATLLAVALFIIATSLIFLFLKLYEHKKIAFKTSVMAGDPADCPIPSEDWRKSVEQIVEPETETDQTSAT